NQMDKVKPATINRALSVIRRALYLAEEWKLIDRAPKVKMLEGERQREFVLTGALRDEFIGGLPEPCKTVARFLVDTGMRVGECCALTWDRVFLDGEQAYILWRGASRKPRGVISRSPQTLGQSSKRRRPFRGHSTSLSVLAAEWIKSSGTLPRSR